MFYLIKELEEVNKFPFNEILPQSGALVEFSGVVRNHNNDKEVKGLFYEAYESMALKEGQKILDEAKEKFDIHAVSAFHFYGYLPIGGVAVRIISQSSHRKEAFLSTEYVINEMKLRLPIWKREQYLSDDDDWVYLKEK